MLLLFRFQAQVQLRGGQYDGKEMWFDYEDICKLAAPSSR